MNLVFYRTTDVFEAEERFQEHGMAVEIVPTPVQDKAYCGVCIYIKEHIWKYVHILFIHIGLPRQLSVCSF